MSFVGRAIGRVVIKMESYWHSLLTYRGDWPDICLKLLGQILVLMYLEQCERKC
jgi:hypothetical protein